MVNEAADGADTVEWMRGSRGSPAASPPSESRIWASLSTHCCRTRRRNWSRPSSPPVPTISAHRRGVPARSRVNDFLGWSNLVAHQEDPGRLRAGVRQLRAQKRVGACGREAPLGAAGRALLGERAPWWESWLTPRRTTTRSGGRCNVGSALDQVQVPVLLLSGWQDLFLGQTLASVPAPSRAGRRRRADHGAVDPHPVARRRSGHHRPGNPGMAGHPSGRSPRYHPFEPSPVLRLRRRLARAARLAAGHHRA